MKYSAYDLFPTRFMLDTFFVLIIYADIKCPINSEKVR